MSAPGLAPLSPDQHQLRETLIAKLCWCDRRKPVGKLLCVKCYKTLPWQMQNMAFRGPLTLDRYRVMVETLQARGVHKESQPGRGRSQPSPYPD